MSLPAIRSLAALIAATGAFMSNPRHMTAGTPGKSQRPHIPAGTTTRREWHSPGGKYQPHQSLRERIRRVGDPWWSDYKAADRERRGLA